MHKNTFFIQLGLIAIGVIALNYALCYAFPALWVYQNFFWASHIFFILLTVISFIGAKIAIQRSNINAFSQFIMFLVLNRLLLSIVLVLVYYKKMHPENKLFLVPFFFVYLAYTIYEVLFLSKIGRER